MASNRYDAVIIGGGHNGLVCGAYLAKAGLKTVVVERRHVIGGAAVTEEVFPGFRMSVASYVMSLLAPRVIADLELRSFGLKILPANELFCPLDAKDGISWYDDPAKCVTEFARFSRHDADNYLAFNTHIQDAANVVRRLLWETPPDPAKRDWKSFKETAALLWRFRDRAGKIYDLADLMSQSVDTYLSRWFESDIVKAVLGYYASIGTFAGPRTPGTAYVLMHHIMGEHQGAGGWGFVEGGMGAISHAVAMSGARFGLEVRADAPVASVKVSDGRATGVVLTSGEEIDAAIVASNADCKTLFKRLLQPDQLPHGFTAEIDQYRTSSTAFKLNIACHEPPRYTAFDQAKAGFDYPTYVHIGPTIDYLERAYDDAKHGWYSARPFLTPVVPTIVDRTLAPPGKHVVNVFGGHAPHTLKDGDWAVERERFVKNVMNVFETYAPGFKDQIIDMQVLLAPDLEQKIGLPQGHIFHGELSPDQLFLMRPVPHYADYRTPVRGLYQCGASTHPGGGVSGIPGHNAAREILKDRKKRLN